MFETKKQSKKKVNVSDAGNGSYGHERLRRRVSEDEETEQASQVDWKKELYSNSDEDESEDDQKPKQPLNDRLKEIRERNLKEARMLWARLLLKVDRLYIGQSRTAKRSESEE